MNQQRARRFKSAKERFDVKTKLERLGKDVVKDGFDSNCITPGTQFMDDLGEHVRYFIHKKMTEDVGWKEVEVIFSSSQVFLFDLFFVIL